MFETWIEKTDKKKAVVVENFNTHNALSMLSSMATPTSLPRTTTLF